jgi:hypothetical protein
MPRTYGMPARPSSASEQAERAGKATGLTLPTSLVSRRLPVDGFGREEQAKWTSDGALMVLMLAPTAVPFSRHAFPSGNRTAR